MEMIKLFSKQNAFSMEKWRSEAGATATEYALLVGLVAIVLISAVTPFGTTIANKFNEAACELSSPTKNWNGTACVTAP